MRSTIKSRLLKQIKKLEHGNKRHRRWLRGKGAKILLKFIYEMRYEARCITLVGTTRLPKEK